jgi:hypothetical protein
MDFNIGTHCGSHIPLNSACFGLLRYMPITVDTLVDCFRDDYDEHLEDWEDSGKFFDIEPDNIKYIDFSPHAENTRRATGFGITDVIKHLQTTMQDLPMFKDCFEVKRRLGVCRIFVKDMPADKVLLALMIARSTCSHFGQYSQYEGYKAVVEKGYSPRVTLLGHMFAKGGGLSDSDKFCLNSMNESAIFNPSTFGIEAVIAFLRQDENYSPWVQEPLSSTGYSRESDFQSDREIFNPRAPLNENRTLNEVYNLSERTAYSNHGLGTRYRSLTDCFSIPEDYTHFTEEVTSNCWGEFVSTDKIDNNSFFKLFDFFETLRRGT